jgi:hypothetical protein
MRASSSFMRSMLAMVCGGEHGELLASPATGQLGVAAQREHQHARGRDLRRHARAQHVAGAHAAVGAVARDVDDLVAVHHAQVRDFVGAGGHALQKGLHHARQAGRFQVRLAQAQHARREPEQLAVAGHVAHVLQA